MIASFYAENVPRNNNVPAITKIVPGNWHNVPAIAENVPGNNNVPAIIKIVPGNQHNVPVIPNNLPAIYKRCIILMNFLKLFPRFPNYLCQKYKTVTLWES